MNIQQILELGAANSGGSGTGCSHYLSMRGCHLRHTLYERRKKELGETSGSGFDADVGTFYHLLQEYYWRKELESESAFEVSDLRSDPTYEAMEEALRLFRYFRKEVVPPDVRDEFVFKGAELLMPANESEAAKLENLFGVTWTGRADLIIEVPNQKAGNKLAGILQLGDELEPGVYLIDWKTKKRRPGNAFFEYMYGSIQMPSYMMAMKELFGEEPKGAIPWFAVRLKGLRPDCFTGTLIDYPSPSKQDTLKAWFENAQKLYDAAPEAPTGAGTQCYQYGRLCEFAISGDCGWGYM